MPDYTIEVTNASTGPDYEFVTENVQVVTSLMWDNDRGEYETRTLVPVYQTPEPDRFWNDVQAHINTPIFEDQPYINVYESSGDLLVDGLIEEPYRLCGIAFGGDAEARIVVDGEVYYNPDGGGPIDPPLIVLPFQETVDSVPSSYTGTGEPPYPTPWGRYVEHLGYCYGSGL